MSVTEADDTVLQDLTNGDLATTDEVHDASSVSNEDFDLKDHVKEVLAADPLGKATDVAGEVMNPLASELHNMLDTQSSPEAALSLTDAPLPSKLNEVTEEYTINPSPVLLDSAEVDTDSIVAAVEQDATSSIEDSLSKPNEDIVEPNLTVTTTIENGAAEESSAEIIKDSGSADPVTDVAAAGAEDVNVDGAKSDSASVVTSVAAPGADVAAAEDQVSEAASATLPTQATEESVTQRDAVAAVTEVISSSVESDGVEDTIIPQADDVVEVTPVAPDEQAGAESEATREAAAPVAVEDIQSVESGLVDDDPAPASEIEASVSAEVPSPLATEETIAQTEEAPAESFLNDDVPTSSPEVASVDEVEPPVIDTESTSEPTPLTATVEELAATGTEAALPSAPGDAAPEPAIATTEAEEAAPTAEASTTVEPEVASVNSTHDTQDPVVESLPVEPSAAEETTVPATERSPAVEPGVVEETHVELSSTGEASASEPITEAGPQVEQQPPVDSVIVEDVLASAQEPTAEAALSIEAQVVEAPPTEDSATEEGDTPAPEPVEEAGPAVEAEVAQQPPVGESSMEDDVSAAAAEPTSQVVPAEEPEVIDQPSEETEIVQEVSAPAAEPEAEAMSANEEAVESAGVVAESSGFASDPVQEAAPPAEPVAEQPPVVSTIVEEVSEPAPETAAEATAEAEPLVEQPAAESTAVEEVSEPAPETIAEATAEAEPVVEQPPAESTAVEEVSEPAPETIAEATAEAEPVVEQPSAESTAVEEVSVPAPETIAEATAEAELVVEQPPIEFSVDELSVPAPEPLATPIAAEPQIREELPIEPGVTEEVSAAVTEPSAEVEPAAEEQIVEQPPTESNVVAEAYTSAPEPIADAPAVVPEATEQLRIEAGNADEVPVSVRDVVEVPSDENPIPVADSVKVDEDVVAPELPVVAAPTPIDEGVAIEETEAGPEAPHDGILELVEGTDSVVETEIAAHVEAVAEDAPVAEHDKAVEPDSESEPVDINVTDVPADETTAPHNTIDSDSAAVPQDVEHDKVEDEVIAENETFPVAAEEANGQPAVALHDEISQPVEDALVNEVELVAPEGAVSDDFDGVEATATAAAPEEVAAQPAPADAEVVLDAAAEVAADGSGSKAEAAFVENAALSEPTAPLAGIQVDPESEPVAPAPEDPIAVEELEGSNDEVEVAAHPEAASTASPVEPEEIAAATEPPVVVEIPSVVEETKDEPESAPAAAPSVSEDPAAPQEDEAAAVDPVPAVPTEEPTSVQEPVVPQEEDAPDAGETPAALPSEETETHIVIEESTPAPSAAIEESVAPQAVAAAAESVSAPIIVAETPAQDPPILEEQEAAQSTIEEPTPAVTEETTLQEPEETVAVAEVPAAAPETVADREAEEVAAPAPPASPEEQEGADVKADPVADGEESTPVTEPIVTEERSPVAEEASRIVEERDTPPAPIVDEPAVSAAVKSELQPTASEEVAAVLDAPPALPTSTEAATGQEELETEVARAEPESEVETNHDDSSILQAEEAPAPNDVTDNHGPSDLPDESVPDEASANGAADEPADVAAPTSVEEQISVEATEAAPSTLPPHLVSFAVTHTGAGGVHDDEGAQDDEPSKRPEDMTPAEVIEEHSQSESGINEEKLPAIIAGDSLAVDAEVERPSSPWTSSFQVTTVGLGGATNEQETEPEETIGPIAEAGLASPEVQEQEPPPAEELPAVVEAATQAEEISENAYPSGIVPPQLLVDTSSLEDAADQPDEPAEPPQPLTPSYSVHPQGSPRHDNIDLQDTVTQEEPARPWTPSYSVHSQGSPLPVQRDLADEEPSPSNKAVEYQEEELGELEEMEFATNEEILTTNAAPTLETSTNAAHVSLDPRGTNDLSVEETRPDVTVEDDAAVSIPSNGVEDGEVEDAVPGPETQVPHLVLDVSEEATQPSTDEGEQSSTYLGAQPEHDRPASPSWIPSYSVSVQGTPSHERADPLDEIRCKPDEVLAEVVSVAVPAESTAADAAESKSHDIVDAAEVVPKMVISEKQTSAEVEHHDVAVANVSPAVVEVASAEVTEALGAKDVSTDAITAPEALLVVDEDGVTVKDVSNENDGAQNLSAEEQELRKSRPWTPSYSVTTQGPKTASEECIAEHAEVAEVLNDVPVPQDPVAGEFKDALPTVAVDTIDETQDGPSEVFPIVEDGDKVPEQPKSTGLRLIPLDETRVTDVALVSPDAVSPTTVRSRLESTASSRYFPGSWFSPTYRPVDEGRTSLEVAQGEFIAAKAAASADEAPDTSSIEESSSDESDDDEEVPESATSEQKRRWCIIM
ncbi:hypothetical protein LshimejAT787_0800720 [Lyophyllum shimeji]|uniref:Uncharacterized protein n=1 Tax=Lyophyllum shimeji TaxID=47721 RepID=A0A9P3PRW1_LYOSH|nr:hypothetical protein LshimejAT787_0800720 [Lyophyllum shimeji]